MPLKIHLRDCHGDGRRLSARSAILQVGDGSIELGDSPYLSFKKGALKLDSGKELRVFGLGEGFASMENASISVISDRVVESPAGPGSIYNDQLNSMEARRCAVCEIPVNDDSHCQTVDGRRIDLCCPRCAETFIQAHHLVRKLDTAQTETRSEPT